MSAIEADRNFRPYLRLSQLYIYPIKSAGGISLKSAEVVERGLRYDRRWMVVDASNRFLSQRELPRMARISVQLVDDGLFVSAPEMTTMKVPDLPETARTIPVTIWEDSVEAFEFGAETNEWFSDFLGVPCKLVYMPDETNRLASRNNVASRVSFADAYPLLLISEASLEDLNSRLSGSVAMNRFRPNIVVKGCEPFAEDTWKEIFIGAVRFHLVKPCARCTITTVDQTTGIKGKEPLRTLASYREHNGSVMFGQNLIHGNTGIVHVGDALDIIQIKTLQPYSQSKENIS